MKKTIFTVALLLGLASLPSGCSSWREVTVRVSEQEIQERISKKFPITKSYEFVGTVTYANPRITLRTEDNRVELKLDIVLGKAGHAGSINGCAEMIAAVAYNAEKKALYLTDPRLRQFAVDGIPEQNVQLLSSLFMPAIEKLLKRKPVYRLTSENGRNEIAARFVKDIRVREGCLEIVYGV